MGIFGFQYDSSFYLEVQQGRAFNFPSLVVYYYREILECAAVAQLVERHFRKV